MFKRVRNSLTVLLFVFMLFALTSCKNPKVNEKEWVKAFSVESFSNCTILCVTGEEGLADSERITIDVENGKYSYIAEEVYANGGKFELDEQLFYSTDENGLSWVYYKDYSTNNWVKKVSQNYALNGLKEIIDYYKNLFFMFEYNDENEVYVKIEEDQIHNIYFKNGKLTEIKITYLDDVDVFTATVQFKNYGKCKVNLPL